MKKLLSFFAVVAVAVAAFSCKKPEPPVKPEPDVALKGIVVAPATLSLEVGQTGTLTVSYDPENATNKPAVEWLTSDPAVATVDNGTVTAVAAGTATITATADKFTATATVTVTDGETPGPNPQPEDTWDYTPGADYTAATNLWKPVSDAGAEVYFYYHCTGDQWNGTPTSATEVPFLTKRESTYRLYYEDATYGEVWLNQLFIYSDEDHLIPIDPGKKYKFTVTLGSNSATPAFLKLAAYKPASAYAESDNAEAKAKHEGATIWEKGMFTLDPATPTVLETEFSGIEANGINLVMAFGGNPEKTYIYIKDIILVETGEVTPVEPVDNWDYTPSAAYKASTKNLWKPVFDGDFEEIAGNIAGYPSAPVTVADLSNVTKKESTYKWVFGAATEGEWGCCNFLSTQEGHFIPMKAGKKYKLQVTIGASADISKFVFSLHAYNPADPNGNHEGDWKTDMWGDIKADTPKTFETEFECTADMDNITWTIIPQFGTPAGMILYIKDLIVEEVAEPQLFDPTNFAAIDWSNKDAATWYYFASNYALPDGFTVILHVYPNSLKTPGMRVCNFGNNTESPCNMLRFGQNGNNAEVEWMVDHGTGRSQKELLAAGFKTGEWQAIVLTADKATGSYKIYRNAELGSEKTFTYNESMGFGAFEFANSWGASWRSAFDGRIALLSVYDKALTAEEIAENIFTTPVSKSCVGFWPMTEGEGGLLKADPKRAIKEDIDLTKAIRNDDDNTTVNYSVDVTPYITWTKFNAVPANSGIPDYDPISGFTW